MHLARTVVEAASWRLASRLSRRRPERVTVHRKFPGGGQYDVLAVSVHHGGTRVILNRHGTIQVHTEDGTQAADWEPTVWLEYLCADPVSFGVRDSNGMRAWVHGGLELDSHTRLDAASDGTG